MSCEITLLKDSSELDVSFSYGAFYDICQRAAARATEEGKVKLADDFKFGIKMRELYFWDVSDEDRRFLVGVLQEILADDEFFTWPEDIEAPDVIYCHPDGTTSRPANPKAVVKQGAILGVTKLIGNLQSLITT